MSNPEDRLPSPGIRVLAAVGAVALVAAAIVLSRSETASAAGLEAFASCAELEQHLTDAWDPGFATGGAASGDVAEDSASGAPGAPAPATTAAQGREESGLAGGDDGTNVQVAGVDELDVVELLADGRSLVAREDRVLLVSADGREVLASLSAPAGPQLTFDEERGVLWVVGADDWQTTTLVRAAVGAEGFGVPSTWSVAGRLVDLRRAGETVHLVAVDDEVLPIEPGPASSGAAEDAALPFSGTSPVPCERVLRSPLPGGPATTLVARFSAGGELAPTAATEIVGAGDNVLVTDDAVYVSTPVYDGDRELTGIHRFDADDLTLTGSGSVEGRLLNQFSLDEYAGHLRAAVTVGGGFFVGGPMPMPMPVDDVEAPAADPAVSGEVEGQASGEVVHAAIGPTQDTTDTTQPEPPASEPTTSTTGDPTTSTTIEPTTTTIEPPTTTESTTTTEAPVTTVPPEPGDALNEIVVFDLDGSLDVVGRSPRFGHPGETLHGIRFAGAVAYAVTFLQTDPFYVVDLTDPQVPRVLGELEIPGFSAYLHPISATQVIGFGPGPEGGVLARLFDVSDPAAPRLLDTVRIADDSPIVYDPHALRADGGRLLVAANDWVAEPPARCAGVEASEADLEAMFRELDTAYAGLERDGGGVLPPEVEALERRVSELSECVYPGGSPRARIVTLDPGAGGLGVTSTRTEAGEAQRILPLGDGGYLVVGAEVTRVSAGGAIEASLA